jgi:hypothetical protein
MITAPVLPTFDIQGMSNRWTRFTASDNVQPKALPETTRGQNSSVVGRARGIDRNASLALATITHPHPALAPLSLYVWIAFAGAHEARHTQQIRERLGV